MIMRASPLYVRIVANKAVTWGMEKMGKPLIALITGCSTGIGRALCQQLARKGYIVVATARDVQSINDLPVALTLQLDVTNKLSVDAAIRQVIAYYHRIDLLVNNAGYSLRGALEEVDTDQAKKIFDVNVFGIVTMVHAILPIMCENRSGRIINIGSISGRFVQPINGIYCASKFAVEALTAALRLELRKFHIDAAVIEPGPIATHFFKTLSSTSSNLLARPDSCYAHFYQADLAHRKQQKRAPADEAAQAIVKIIGKRKLKPRYTVAVPKTLKLFIHLPNCLKEYLLRRQ